MIREVLTDRNRVGMPFPASTAVAIGNACWWDDSAKVAKNASARTDLGAISRNQADFRALFLGIALDQRLSTETSTGNDSRRVLAVEGVFDCDCASATFEVGDLVGIDRSATPLNYDSQVIAVTSAALAIGRVIQRVASAATKVRCYISAYEFGYFAKRFSQGVMQGPGLIAASDADTTLTVAQVAAAALLTMTPGANPRKVILPAEGQSAGFALQIQNLAGATNGIQVRNSADATTIITIPATKAGVVRCDGTTWYGLVGA